MPVNRFGAMRMSRLGHVLAGLARRALPAFALALIGVNGCGKEKTTLQADLPEPLRQVEMQSLDSHSELLAGGPPQPMDYKPPKVSLNGIAPAAAPSTASIPGNTNKADYYTTFCDIYWKLNWMRKELRHGSVPYNMQDEIEKTFKELKPLPKDGNYTLADEALQRMQKGLEHLACLHALRVVQIDDLQVPWEAGLTAVQQYFDRNRTSVDGPIAQSLPTPAHDTGNDGDEEGNLTHTMSTMPDSTPTGPGMVRQHAINLAINYAARYRMGPRAMMQREWETAIRRTNKLRNNLHLEHRPQNNDGDALNVDLAIDMAAGDNSTIHVPAGAGVSAIAPVPVDYPEM